MMCHGLCILIQDDVGKFSVSISYEDMHDILLEVFDPSYQVEMTSWSDMLVLELFNTCAGEDNFMLKLSWEFVNFCIIPTEGL